jgi:hypothetical protein
MTDRRVPAPADLASVERQIASSVGSSQRIFRSIGTRPKGAEARLNHGLAIHLTLHRDELGGGES